MELSNTKPLVSIITPSYNQCRFIEETINSVKHQEYSNREHIIIDGGSTDNTLDILKKYEGSYNMHWVSEPDRGMYDAINKGLRMANGEILSYLNSDDLYLPWTVKTVVDYFITNPSVDFVYSDLLTLNMEINKLILTFYPPFNLKFIRRTGSLGQPTVFWRWKVFNYFGGFDESLKFVADCDYWMKAGSVFKIRKVNEFLAIDRNHSQAKRFINQTALKKELNGVRERYFNSNFIQNALGRFKDRIWAFMWQRYYMWKFLYFNQMKHNISNRLAWPHFLSIENLKLVPLYQLLIGTLPFVNRGNPRWICLNRNFNCEN